MRYTIKVSRTSTPALYNVLVKLSETKSLEKEFDINVSNYLRDKGRFGFGYYEVSFSSEQSYLMFLLKWT
jgi:hypothetical protein